MDQLFKRRSFDYIDFVPYSQTSSEMCQNQIGDTMSSELVL